MTILHQSLAKSKGLTSKLVFGSEEVEIDKELWYHGIRNRLSSVLMNFTDEELEKGIEELEGEFVDRQLKSLHLVSPCSA